MIKNRFYYLNQAEYSHFTEIKPRTLSRYLLKLYKLCWYYLILAVIIQ